GSLFGVERRLPATGGRIDASHARGRADRAVRVHRWRLDGHAFATGALARPFRDDLGFLNAGDRRLGGRKTALDGAVKGGLIGALIGTVGGHQRFRLGGRGAGAGRIEGLAVDRRLVEDIAPFTDIYLRRDLGQL